MYISTSVQLQRKQFEISLKTLQEEDKRCAGLTEAAKDTRLEMLTRVSAEKQKLQAMLKGLCLVLSDQESLFLSLFHRLRWRLEEQQRDEAVEMSWIQQSRAELQAKCQQPDGDLLGNAQTTLSREEGAAITVLLMSELETELEDFTRKTNMLTEAVTQFKDMLECSLEEDSEGSLSVGNAGTESSQGLVHTGSEIETDSMFDLRPWRRLGTSAQ
ncbi:PREDICTED: uncharacterized protein LOC106628173 [Pseudopodoces humilis]|uniref:uncharacterized protein LOC106628173 n=1 Tax=Pseudopodoces humilis TaxID=181119 RepID=UPI0006B71E4F|nr:PREDICTED: uncharacterized protein LOC106628173 [Pseudopodoces humilis]